MTIKPRTLIIALLSAVVVLLATAVVLLAQVLQQDTAAPAAAAAPTSAEAVSEGDRRLCAEFSERGTPIDELAGVVNDLSDDDYTDDWALGVELKAEGREFVSAVTGYLLEDEHLVRATQTMQAEIAALDPVAMSDQDTRDVADRLGGQIYQISLACEALATE